MSTIKRQRRTFTEDFKRDALALVDKQGYSITEAAQSLGIHENLLYKWRHDFKKQDTGTSLTPDERTELKRLRKENKRLLMEAEILKKASAYFAKEIL